MMGYSIKERDGHRKAVREACRMETRDPVVLAEMALGYIPLLTGSNQVKARMVVSRAYGMRWRGSGILKLALHMVGEAGNPSVAIAYRISAL